MNIKLLASQGNKIVLGARRADRLSQIAEAIKKDGGEVVYKVTDVTSLVWPRPHSMRMVGLTFG